MKTPHTSMGRHFNNTECSIRSSPDELLHFLFFCKIMSAFTRIDINASFSQPIGCVSVPLRGRSLLGEMCVTHSRVDCVGLLSDTWNFSCLPPEAQSRLVCTRDRGWSHCVPGMCRKSRSRGFPPASGVTC